MSGVWAPLGRLAYAGHGPSHAVGTPVEDGGVLRICSEEFALSIPIRQYGTWGVIALLALRLGVGWHFFKEGSKKFTDAGVPSVAFLRGATGPLAESYKSFIPDRYGRDRLSPESTTAFWNRYKDRVARHFGFDSTQSKAADQIVRTYSARMKNFIRDNGEDIEEYYLELERLADARSGQTRSVPFQRARIAKKESELWGKVSPWLADVKTLSQQLQKDLAAVATDAQRAGGAVPIPDRSQPVVIDTTIKFVVLIVGILLVLGLFTRVAAVAGMLFLLSVISTQPPWVAAANTQFFYYQMVEVLALFVVLVFAAGQCGGLDYVIHGLYRRCCPPKSQQL